MQRLGCYIIAVTFIHLLVVPCLGFAGLRIASTDHPEDWSSPESLSSAVYSIVSGPAGQQRDWDRYRALFREGARFITFGANQDSTEIFKFGVEDYIKWYGPSMLERGIYEKQIWHRTEQYGRLAQRWGTCEYRWQSPDGPPGGRCLVSIQFIFDGARWWIASVIWEGGLKPEAVPAHYLPKPVR
jgi:hypothetical protein